MPTGAGFSTQFQIVKVSWDADPAPCLSGVQRPWIAQMSPNRHATLGEGDGFVPAAQAGRSDIEHDVEDALQRARFQGVRGVEAHDHTFARGPVADAVEEPVGGVLALAGHVHLGGEPADSRPPPETAKWMCGVRPG